MVMETQAQTEIIPGILSLLLPQVTEKSNPFGDFNDWVNSFLFSEEIFHETSNLLGDEGSHYLLTYIRDLIGGTLLYYITAGIWHLYIYNYKGDKYFTALGYDMPTREVILDQILLAQMSIFMYAGLPVLAEWFIENNMTLCYFNIEDIGGWIPYLSWTLVYLTVVEIGVYWMHRTLHENKTLYTYIHALHHKYNKPSTLSPWASIAFNPLDGILQACPYVICLFFIPCHYLTHVILLFFTAVWATNIHDALEGDTEPIMGSKYHTMHHTHYHYNFGQFFIFCDYIFGTLRVPEKRHVVYAAKQEKLAARKKMKEAEKEASTSNTNKKNI